MAPLRLRHPNGVSTIQIDLESATVQDLLQEIYKITEILPSQQDGASATPRSSESTLTHFSVKSGYPPKSLALIPELPISSLGLSKGEQLIVNQNGGGPNTRSAQTRSATGIPDPGVAPQPRARASAPDQPTTNEADSVETEGGYLVHRVCHSRSVPRCRVADRSAQIVPDDNSCLFSSVAIVFEQNIAKAQEIRKSASSHCWMELPLTIRSRGG
jgi:ubiquitin thioesterase OTU1